MQSSNVMGLTYPPKGEGLKSNIESELDSLVDDVIPFNTNDSVSCGIYIFILCDLLYFV